MNLFELAPWGLGAFAGFAVGSWVSHNHGPVTGLAAGGAAFVGGFIVGLTVAPVAFLVVAFQERYRASRPVCQRGRCGEHDYTLKRDATTGHIYHCKCGDQYLMIKEGSRYRRFMQLQGDNKLPYKEYVPWRGWVADTRNDSDSDEPDERLE